MSTRDSQYTLHTYSSGRHLGVPLWSYEQRELTREDYTVDAQASTGSEPVRAELVRDQGSLDAEVAPPTPVSIEEVIVPRRRVMMFVMVVVVVVVITASVTAVLVILAY